MYYARVETERSYHPEDEEVKQGIARIGAVSYTHLDVYKRQLLENLGIKVEPNKYPDYDSRIVAQVVQGKKRFDICLLYTSRCV